MKYRSHLYDIFFRVLPNEIFDRCCRIIYNREQRQGTASINRRLPNHIRMEKGRLYMKSVGIIRKVDDLGRIVLPAERGARTLDIAEQDAMEIYVDGASVVLRKYERLAFLRLVSGHFVLPGKNVCSAVFTPCSRWANSNTTEVLSGIQHIAILFFPTTQFLNRFPRLPAAFFRLDIFCVTLQLFLQQNQKPTQIAMGILVSS